MVRRNLSNNSRLRDLMTGMGFELAVASELLLRGFSCNLALIDAGIDIVAWNQEGKRVNIQVKGRNISGHGTGVETVHFRKVSYDDPETKPDFAIIPIRNTMEKEVKATYGKISYLILSQSALSDLRRQGYLPEDDSELKLQLNVSFDEKTGIAKQVLLQKSYGRRQERSKAKNVTELLNRWRELASSL